MFKSTFNIYWYIWSKFGTKDVDTLTLSICEFRENRCSYDRNILKGVRDLLPGFLQFSSNFNDIR